jgi:hypothetical protein
MIFGLLSRGAAILSLIPWFLFAMALATRGDAGPAVILAMGATLLGLPGFISAMRWANFRLIERHYPERLEKSLRALLIELMVRKWVRLTEETKRIGYGNAVVPLTETLRLRRMLARRIYSYWIDTEAGAFSPLEVSAEPTLAAVLVGTIATHLPATAERARTEASQETRDALADLVSLWHALVDGKLARRAELEAALLRAPDMHSVAVTERLPADPAERAWREAAMATLNPNFLTKRRRFAVRISHQDSSDLSPR